jgi:hypothetical protein
MMQMPGMLDWFGWCTWDAFYTEVNPQGIKDGLKRSVLFLFKYRFYNDMQNKSSLLEALSLCMSR